MARKVNRYEKNHPKNRHHHSMGEGLQDKKNRETRLITSVKLPSVWAADAAWPQAPAPILSLLRWPAPSNGESK